MEWCPGSRNGAYCLNDHQKFHSAVVFARVPCSVAVQGAAICLLPLAVGIGGANIQRWYFDQNTQKCLAFIYGGLYGNQNNFLTQQQCEQACPDQCSSNYWCHIGATAQTTVCCPGRGSSFYKLFFSSIKIDCEAPVYNVSCAAVEGYAICQQAMAPGTGTANLQRWYYDINARQCLPFTYKGMMGNQNNFLTKQQCQLACPAYTNVCPQGVPLLDASTNLPKRCTFAKNSCGPDHWCHLGLIPDEYQCCPGEPTNPAACKGLPYSVGVTGAPAPPAIRWYYDKASMSCKTFEYYGRKGNQNNFLTEADCSATCKGSHRIHFKPFFSALYCMFLIVSINYIGRDCPGFIRPRIIGTRQ
ncbi:unnamed protein product [Gongylonema pulchrum]|uniref:BPTI/Kunitz inhibitor domain-containing protein n=1 Tax=Gongylonema pulchrum TaxID=637853 RepID=A0A3P6Q748_9BILA|nr:unnamed protein product [Gongylonema pulchrum]